MGRLDSITSDVARGQKADKEVRDESSSFVQCLPHRETDLLFIEIESAGSMVVSVRSRSMLLSSCVGSSSSSTNRSPLAFSRLDRSKYHPLKKRLRAANSVTSESQVSEQLPTVEEQRKAAREMIAYFQEKRIEKEYMENQKLGWVPKAEISNGRWVMFGLLVGMLTEYATGVDFIDQIKLVLVNLSIVDFD